MDVTKKGKKAQIGLDRKYRLSETKKGILDVKERTKGDDLKLDRGAWRITKEEELRPPKFLILGQKSPLYFAPGLSNLVIENVNNSA